MKETLAKFIPFLIEVEDIENILDEATKGPESEFNEKLLLLLLMHPYYARTILQYGINVGKLKKEDVIELYTSNRRTNLFSSEALLNLEISTGEKMFNLEEVFNYSKLNVRTEAHWIIMRKYHDNSFDISEDFLLEIIKKYHYIGLDGKTLGMTCIYLYQKNPEKISQDTVAEIIKWATVIDIDTHDLHRLISLLFSMAYNIGDYQVLVNVFVNVFVICSQRERLSCTTRSCLVDIYKSEELPADIKKEIEAELSVALAKESQRVLTQKNKLV